MTGRLSRFRSSLQWNALASAGGHLSVFAVVFVTTPIAVHFLGEERWGVWQLIGATTSYALLINLGLGTAIHYQTSFLTARGDYARLGTAIANTRLYMVAVAAVLGVSALLFGRSLVARLVDPHLVDEATTGLYMTIGLTAITLPIRVFPSVLAGLQRYELQGIAQAISGIVLAAAVYAGFALDMGLAGFAAVMTLGPLPHAVVSYIAARRVLPKECFRSYAIDAPFFYEMLRYSLANFLFVGGNVALYQTMKFMASERCGGVEAAGRMGLVISSVQTLAIVFMPLLGVLHARVGQMNGEGRLGEVPALLERAFRTTGLLVVPSVVFLMLRAPALFEAWVGRSFDAAAIHELGTTARLMLAGQGAYALCLPAYFALLGIGRHRLLGWAMLGTAIANAAGGWLVTASHPGIPALGLVFGVLLFVMAIGVTLPAAARSFSLSIGPLLARGFAAPFLATIPASVAVLWRPRAGGVPLDLAIDAALFGLLVLPGLEWIRRSGERTGAGLRTAPATPASEHVAPEVFPDAN
jgi:O-antigen/teichoic acid export membrane protein